MAVNTTLYGKQGDGQVELAPKTVSQQVIMNDVDGTPSTVEDEIVELRHQISGLAGGGGISFKGALTSSEPLPTVSYKAGWQYVVQEAGTYAGNTCEVGDFVVCIKDYASGSASNKDWTVLQVNLVGAVTGPASAVAAHVATFKDVSGKTIQDSGFTIGKSVPGDAKFTDTTYVAATDSADGLLTAGLHKKLVGIEEGADKTDTANVTAAGALMKSTTTSDIVPQGKTNLYMTGAERTKLGGIATGAEVNQNTFSKVKVGSVMVEADNKTDTLEISGGTGITVSADAGADKVTITEQYVDSCVVSSLDAIPANLREGGLIILKQ